MVLKTGDCAVDNIKMSDYGITKEELAKLASEVRAKMQSNFANDPTELTAADCEEIYLNSWR